MNGDTPAGEALLPTPENVQKVVDLLRAKDAETVKAIGHLMDAEEVSLFKMAADIIDAYRRPVDGEAEGFATWHRARAGEWRKTAAAYLKDIEPNKSGHDRCITKAEFHEAAAEALARRPAPAEAERLAEMMERRAAYFRTGYLIVPPVNRDEYPYGGATRHRPALFDDFAKECAEAAAALRAPAVAGWRVAAEKIAENVALAVCELPDRTSPDDWPEALLVTANELHEIVLNEVLSALPPAPRAEEDTP